MQGRLRQSMKHARASLAKKKQRTVAAVFKTSLAELMDVLKASEPHFIRCVKPNHQKKSAIFDAELVTKQLRYTGMLETTRIRREGYASRPLFADFVQRYKVLGFPCRTEVRPTADSCRQILKSAGIDGYQVGKTKVFMRYYHADELNGKLEPYVSAATMLSRYCRGFAARSKYGALLEAKNAQDAAVMSFCSAAERSCQGTRDVMQALIDEDNKRPAGALAAASAAGPPLQDRAYKKGKSDKKKGMSRAASVKWFKETEAAKGSGMADDGGFASWFHGIITRSESETLLKGQPSGTFLIRVAESRFGYSLSLNFKNRCKHFMIDQDADGRYLVVGNDRTFPSLNQVVEFHKRHPVTDDGDTLLIPCPTEGPRDDLAELE
jgi:myosin-3